MYRLNVQVTAYGRQTIPDRGVVISCNSFFKYHALTDLIQKSTSEVIDYPRKGCV